MIMEYLFNSSDKPYLKYFKEICSIPHTSYDEKALSDYIVKFAQERNLWCEQDELFNVIIKKTASSGYENHPAVMLQAHIDMVGVKEDGVSFDFKKDPLNIYEKDGFIYAEGTSLGADCGHGISYILAILDSHDLKHPPLEVLFTVQEEVGMGGAKSVDYSKFKAKNLIGTDSMIEGRPEMSTTTVISGNLVKENAMYENKTKSFHLSVRGLAGGHGGADIHRERANAIKIAARILYNLSKQSVIKIGSITGGTLPNNIPSLSDVFFTCDNGDILHLSETVKDFLEKIKEEYSFSEPAISINIDEMPVLEKTISEENTSDIINLLSIIPVGVYMRNAENPEILIASRNMGMVQWENGKLTINYMMRSSVKSQISLLMGEMEIISGIYDVRWHTECEYSGYSRKPGSALYKIYEDVYREETGKELNPLHIHAGTEGGTILEHIKDIDMICIGPNTQYIHTPKERLDIASYHRAYNYIIKVLKQL